MFDLVTFGETMLRLTPSGSKTIEQGFPLNMYPAGSEMNVAVAVSRLGFSTSYVTKLSRSPMGRFINNKSREHGVDTDWIKWSDDRQGLYFFENPSVPRSGVAYYDRENSAFSNMKLNDFDWEAILKNTKFFFTSGINPAINNNINTVTLNGIKTAKKLGKIVAFDINYRSKLWDRESAKEKLKDYLPYVDILFTSESDARDILGFKNSPGEGLLKDISDKYDIATVCMIYSPDEVADEEVGANKSSLWEIISLSEGKIYRTEQKGNLLTVDRLGAGDAFAGGFLTGFLESGPELGVNLGNALITLTNTYLGDLTWVTREQVNSFLNGKINMLER